MNEPIVFLNGQFTPASQAKLNIYDAGIVLGATVTEMTRTFGHTAFCLEEHIQRLFRSLKYVRFDIGMSPDQLLNISQEVLRCNTALIDTEDELGLIHFVTAGEYATYAGSAGGSAHTTPTVCIHSFPMPWELWSHKLEVGMHVVTPSIRHVPPQCFDPKMKYRSRMHYYLADQEARLVDPAAAALLLDLDGNVTETSGGNFLLFSEGQLISPTRRNILPGVSRATTIDIARELSIPFVERDIQVHCVMNADEAFVSSTPYCMMPVTKINGVPIGSGRPGPMYHCFMEAWSRRVGLDVVRQITRGAARRTARTESAT
ncbi:MAG: putative branched-chain-amino-acid aminotransferase [Planctomycetota bacterium]